MTDAYEFLNMTAEEMKISWLDFIEARDPLIQDRSDYSVNSILAEAVASQFWIYTQLLKQLMIDTNPMTAEGIKLSALVLDRLPEGRQPGERAIGALTFSRENNAVVDYIIPAGTTVAAIADDGTPTYFTSTETVTMIIGTKSITAEARAVNIGVEGNVSAYTVESIITPTYGVTSATNELPFTGGTDGESDADLRRRYIYTIWEQGKATITMMEEHIDALADVREVAVTTVGQGDALVVVDSLSGIEATPTEVEAIRAKIEEEIAAGVTCPGLLAATLRPGGHTFELGDSSGGQVWIRSRQYLSAPATVPFQYVDTAEATKDGTVTMPAGTPEGGAVLTTLEEVDDLAMSVTASSYAGSLDFDVFIGLGTYPHCYVCPELQEVDVTATIETTSDAEADLLESIGASVQARLSDYRMGETVHHNHVLRCFFVDYLTNRVFQGVHDVPTLTLTCKGNTISFGGHLDLEADERAESGDLTGITET